MTDDELVVQTDSAFVKHPRTDVDISFLCLAFMHLTGSSYNAFDLRDKDTIVLEHIPTTV